MKENTGWVGEHPKKCPKCENFILTDASGVERCFKCGYVKSLTLNQYQKMAMTTCMSTSQNESYMFLNLVGEVGELASKMAKAIRKGKAIIDSNKFLTECGSECMTDEEIADLKSECGDVMWQISGLCSVMGWTLEEVCQENLDKLASRKERGVISGDGDRR